MKKIDHITAMVAAALLALTASAHTVERSYISTDKSCYVAGDNVWCSAFCFDVSTGALSELSSTLYVELHSSTGLAQTMKIALEHGRGAGVMRLLKSLPTGNYKLIAYTAQNLNEDGYKFDAVGSKVISIFNVFSKERVKDGVVVSEEYPASSHQAATPDAVVDISCPQSVAASSQMELTISNKMAEALTMSVSVYHRDGIAPVAGDGLDKVVKAMKGVGDVSFSDRILPDYEGEIIRARLSGQFDVDSLCGKFAYISIPGAPADVYCSQIDSLGRMAFFTSNIYGERDLICDIPNLQPSQRSRVEIVTPFVNGDAGEIPPLVISSSISDDLAARGASMQIESRFESDTLFELLHTRSNILLDDKVYRYVLDDYTRFPLMEEVIVEFVTQLRARTTAEGKRDIQVRVEDQMNGARFVRDNSLMLIDGVPVFDQEKIYRYDPLLVKYIDIYPSVFYVGYKQFGGIVNFITYKGDLPSLEFGEDVNVVDFQGSSFPVAYTCEGIDRSLYPDFRQTIYWHPITALDGGQSRAIPVETPSYKGNFDVVVEGISAEGKPFRECSSFEVK